jgi:hypothetical protein
MRAPNCATGPLCLDHSIVAHGGSTGNRIVPGRRSGRPARRRRLTGVRQDQPPRQQVGRFFRCGAVEGHQRCRHSGQASQLRPPSIANQHHLYLIGTAGDVVFEAVNVHRRSIVDVRKRKPRSYADVTCGQAKRGAKTTSTRPPEAIVRRFERRKICPVSFYTAFAPFMHRFSTLVLKSAIRAEKRSSR